MGGPTAARRENEEVAWGKLLDVASWAIGRYQAAGVPPLPIYEDRLEEVKSFFGKARAGRRRSKIGEAHPLRRYFIRHEYEMIPAKYEHWIVLVTGDKQFFAARIGDVPAGITEIVVDKGRAGADFVPASPGETKALFRHNTGDPYSAPLQIDAVCDDIVEYVSDHCDSENPPTSF
jgi:hypothetical protein